MTGKITTTDFDPFRFCLLYRNIKGLHTAWLVLPALAVVGALVLVCAGEGTLGGVADFQPLADAKRTVGVDEPARSLPRFTLMRDIVSWLLVLIVITGAILLHRQWQHLSRCLSRLARNGALVPRDRPRSNRLSKLMRVDRLIAGAPPERALDTIVTRVMASLERRSAGLLLCLGVAALVLTILLVLGLENNVFHVLAPTGLDEQAKAEWTRQAYASWWASKQHTAGHIVYWVLAVFAIFVILNFQVVGVIAVYLVVAMQFVVRPSADWLNRDGRYGWAPLAAVFRTVVWANALLGVTLTIVLAALGIDNYGWVAALVVAYILLVPLCVGVPWLVFRRAAEVARDARAADLARLVERRGLDIDSDLAELAPVIAELERCRSARIRPLRLGTASYSTYAVLAVLPVLLTAAQIFLPLTFGTR